MTRLTYLFLLGILFSFTTCKKVNENAKDNLPQVKTVSVVVNPNGTATVTGKVTSSGNSSISYCGFCLDTLANPDMLTNQKITPLSADNTFTYTYTNFDGFRTYYFKAWATNETGYAMGSAISASHIAFDTSQIPCHPRMQYMVLNSPFTSLNSVNPYVYVTAVEASSSGYEIMAYSSGHILDINFSKSPRSGIYTIADGVTMTFDGITTQAGQYLYVQQINSSTLDITICHDSVWNTNYNLRFNMTTKFRSPS